MRLTTKGRYAVTAMIDLAIHCGDGAVSLPEIAARQSISLSYLEQLFSRLRRRGLVLSARGPGGGYTLNGVATEISIAAIIDAIEESIDATQCGGGMNCSLHGRCLPHTLWEELSGQIRAYLADMTLASLIADPHVMQVAARQSQRAVTFAAQS